MDKELAKTTNEFEITETDMLMVVSTVMIIYFLATQIAPMVSGLQAQAYQGAIDPRELSATQSEKYINLIGNPPYTAWIAADFTNKGPDKAYIGINTPGPWITMESGDSGSINMTGANKRIEIIYYKTDPGGIATISAIGKY